MGLENVRYAIGQLTVDFANSEFRHREQAKKMTRKEAHLLEFLITSSHYSRPQQEIYDELWGKIDATETEQARQRLLETRDGRLRTLRSQINQKLTQIGLTDHHIRASNKIIKLHTQPRPISMSTEHQALETTRKHIEQFGMTFYPDRNALPHFDAWLQQFDKVWISFSVGTVLTNPDMYVHKNIERVLLMDPESPCLEQVLPHFDRSPKEAQTVIRTVTEVAQRNGVQVKWFHSLVCNMVIGNPGADDGIVKWELLMPYVPGIHRPNVAVAASHHNDVVARAKECFKQMWKAARPADNSHQKSSRDMKRKAATKKN